jgi:predicted esterase
MILIHGRGATAHDILTLAPELKRPEFAYFAPQAANNTWYPHSFLAPISQNEPGISSGLQVIADIFAQLETAGIATQRVILFGFSQGGCLALEFAARHAQRYGGIVGLSGGLIGPAGTPRDYAGSFAGTPVFLGCSDPDVHIPKQRFLESAEIFKNLGAELTARLYPNLGHTINFDEIQFTQNMMNGLLAN